MTPNPPPPLADDLRSRWMLKEGVTFLNHGSFGAVPRAVYDEHERLRRAVEAEPVELIGRRWADLVAAAKVPVGELLRMPPTDFGLVTNATEGVNAVLHSLKFKPGDELLTTDHVYNAVRQSMRNVACRWDVGYREVPLPTPAAGAADIARTVLDAISDRTRLLVIDHVTSPTALVFPVAEIIAGCASRGVDVLIDGAHAPGMLDLDIPALGAAYYAGNLHKWCCAPKGCGFLYARPDKQAAIHPCVVSHNYGKGIATEFEWQGTRDISAWMALPAALRFMADLGWERVRRHNHELAVWANRMLGQRLGVTPLSPLGGSLIGSMATLPLPGKLATMSDDEGKALQQSFYTDDRIEVPLFSWQGTWHFRVACAAYTTAAEVERLAEAIESRV